jgi:hypothetical protein
MAAITGPKLGTKLDNPAIKAKVSMSGNPRIHKPKADSTAIKRNQKFGLAAIFLNSLNLPRFLYPYLWHLAVTV